jgi:hypothetical protein
MHTINGNGEVLVMNISSPIKKEKEQAFPESFSIEPIGPSQLSTKFRIMIEGQPLLIIGKFEIRRCSKVCHPQQISCSK